MSSPPRFVPFQPRPIRFLGTIERGGRRLKSYSIVAGGETLERRRFEAGLELALAEMPDPAPESGRPGLGFVILHQGRTGDYLVLCWWDRENELPTLVFVRDGDRWRPAERGEWVCVWDLEILWHERNAYVRTILSAEGGSPELYLAATIP